MLDFLDRLRAKSKGERKTVAFVVAAVVTGIIFIIWLSIIFSGAALSTGGRVSEDSESGIDTFSSLEENITELFKEAREQFDEVPIEENGQENMKIPFN